MMDKSNPADWVFVLLVMQVFGLWYLMAASDGWHHSGKITVRSRKIALVAGMAIIWAPIALVWVFYGHSPADLWNGVGDWWNADIGFMGKLVAICGWWALLSPLQALLALWLIRRAEAPKPEQPMIIRRRS